jgi:hypothetical protein
MGSAVHWLLFQGVSYYDNELTVELYDADENEACRVQTSLVYKALIDAGILEYTTISSSNRFNWKPFQLTAVFDTYVL